MNVPDAIFRDLAYGRFSRAQRIILGTIAEAAVAGRSALLRVRELGRLHGIDHHLITRARRDLIDMGVIATQGDTLIFPAAGGLCSPTLGDVAPPVVGDFAPPPGGLCSPTPGDLAPPPGGPGSPKMGDLAPPSRPLSPHTPLSGNPDQTTTSDSRGGTGAGREPTAAPVGADAYPWTADELAELRGLAVRLWRSEDDAEEIVAAARRLDLPHDGTLAAVRYVAGRDGVKNRVGLAVKTAREWGEEPPARWTADAPTPAERAAALPEIADRQAAEFFARPAMPPAEAARLAAELRRKFGIAPAPAPARMGA